MDHNILMKNILSKKVVIGAISLAILVGLGIFDRSGNKQIFIEQLQMDSSTTTNQSEAPKSSACATFPSLLEASSSQPIRITIPSASSIKTHVDSSSVAEIKNLYFAQVSEECVEVALLFSTTASSGTAEVSVIKIDNSGSDKITEVAKIQIIITNQYNLHGSPALKSVNAQALSSLDTYLKRFWIPILVEKGDFNKDGRDDYLIALESPSIGPDYNDQVGDGKRNRKLLVLGSNIDGSYSALLDSDDILISGDQGGASHPNGPELTMGSTGIRENEVRIVQVWGTSWRGVNVNLFRYDEASKTLKKAMDSSSYFWLNGSFDRTRDYSETNYDNQGNKISTRSFHSLDGISPVKDYKTVQLQNFVAFPEFFASTTYSGGAYYLVPYFHTHDNLGASRLGINANEKEGVFLIHAGKVIWETKNYLEYVEPSMTRFEDVTGDGIDEIVIVETTNSKRDLCNYFLYAWNNGAMNLLSGSEIKQWKNVPREVKDGSCKVISSS
jgi:hypothetical protein